MLQRILSILSAQWLIHEDTAMSYVPAMIAFLRGQQVVLGDYKMPKPYVVGIRQPGEQISLVQYHWELNDENIPENSVAVVVIDGPICSWNSMDIMTRLKEIQENDRINAVLLQVNSPGGMVLGIDLLASAIKNLGKPVVAMTTGMTCSAAAWITATATRRIATSGMDMFGSIGVMTSLSDYKGLFEKYGIKQVDLYATKATRKNEASRAWAESGDTKPMQDFLDQVNEFFHKAITDNLGIKEDSEVLTGATFWAQKALDLGLIDEIGTMDSALETAYSLGLKNKAINQFNSLKF